MPNGQLGARPPAAAILAALLERYERSVSFGRAGPWPRDVIVRFDDKEWPEAFAPNGYDAREALIAAACALADAGALRIVPKRGHERTAPEEFRLGPSELDAAYRAAAPHGFAPVRETLDLLADHARAVRHRFAPMPSWMDAYLERVAAGAKEGDLSPLRIDQRARLKAEWTDVRDALVAAAQLSRGVDDWERRVSETLFSNSKRLRDIRGRVAWILWNAAPQGELPAPEDGGDVLESLGVRRRPAVLQCAGCVEVDRDGRPYNLAHFAPMATLPAAWGEALAAGVARAAVTHVTTVENEYPFFAYVEEAGGPAGLGARGEFVIYTAGFPSRAVAALLAEIARRSPTTAFRHWGDADVGGLRIWWNLRNHVGRPVALFRTTADWVLSESGEREASRLTASERAQLVVMRQRLAEVPHPNAADIREVRALIDALESMDIKVEQERY